MTIFALPAAEDVIQPGNYVFTLLVSSGLVVTVAGLLAIPALRTVPGGPRKRWAPVTMALVALVLPVFIGSRATVHYVDGLDDFTAVPDICASDTLSQERVAEFIKSAPDPSKYAGSSYVTCHWERTGGEGDDAADLYFRITRFDDSRAAAGWLQNKRDWAEDDGETPVDLQLGDDAIRRAFDGSIGSDDSRGVAVEVRIDNVVLETKFDHSEALGTPDSDPLEALAAELVREIESKKPQR